MKSIGVTFILINSLKVFILAQGNKSEPLEHKLSKDICPLFWRSIEINRIDELTTRCKNYLSPTSAKNREMSALRDVCLLGNYMLFDLCKKKINFKSDNQLNLESVEKNNFCPFNLEYSISKEDYFFKIKEILQNKLSCIQLCSDLNDTLKQCSVLKKLDNLLTQLNSEERPISINNMMNPDPSMTYKSQSSKSFLQNNSSHSNNERVILNYNNSSVKNYKTPKEEKIQAQQKLSYIYEYENSTLKSLDALQNKINTDTLTSQDHSNIKLKYSNTSASIEESKDRTNILEQKPNVYKEESSENFNDKVNNTDGIVFNQAVTKVEKATLKTTFPVNENNVFGNKQQHKIDYGERFFQAEESHFFMYFLMLSSVLIIGYLAFHNKNKILAYALEGRNSRRNRRRPNPANYKKLESCLEEVIVSNAPHSIGTNIVY